MGIMELNKKVNELKELEQYMDEVKAEIESLKDEIKREMERQNKEEMTVGVFKVRYKEVKVNRFDTTAFKAAHEDLYNLYKKEGKQKRFSIS